MSRSQNGYPVLTRPQCRVWKMPIKGQHRHFILAPGAPGFLLVHFALWFHDRIQPINVGVWDDWGWAARPIRGSSVISNHASGTAIDLNAVRNPLGRRGGFKYLINGKTAEWRIRYRLRVHYKGCIRWGGDYISRADEMHFEIVAPRAKVKRVATRLRNTKRGKRISSVQE
jgi:hypothetical protein